MPFKPNYRFERFERERLKKAKKEEKSRRQQERAPPPGETPVPPDGEDRPDGFPARSQAFRAIDLDGGRDRD